MKCTQCRSADTEALATKWCCLTCGTTFDPYEESAEPEPEKKSKEK